MFQGTSQLKSSYMIENSLQLENYLIHKTDASDTTVIIQFSLQSRVSLIFFRKESFSCPFNKPRLVSIHKEKQWRCQG